MPKGLAYVALILLILALIPPAVIAQLRAMNSRKPRVHPIQDMDNQPRFEAQHANPIFADGRAMRPPVAGTVARGELADDEHYEKGIVDGQWATTFPDRVTVDLALLNHGRERYEIFCQPCHGAAGYGDGLISIRALELVERGVNGSTWVEPRSIHEPQVREQPVGQLYNSIANGVRNMPPYGPQIPVADRWAIVAYVKALQRSQNASPDAAGTAAARGGETR